MPACIKENQTTVGLLKDVRGSTVSDAVEMVYFLNGNVKPVITGNGGGDGPDIPPMPVSVKMVTGLKEMDFGGRLKVLGLVEPWRIEDPSISNLKMAT